MVLAGEELESRKENPAIVMYLWQKKQLQFWKGKISGHADAGIVMNLSVHVTGDEKVKEIERVESALKIV